MGLFFTIVGIAVALAMDAFAVACAVSLYLGTPTARQQFRISWHFGLFQFLFPIAGWLLGEAVSPMLADYGRLAAFAVLAVLGIKMIIEARRDEKPVFKNDPTRGVSLILFSTAVSIDALAVGFSFPFIGIGVVWPSVLIGVVTSLFSLVGINSGRLISVTSRRATQLCAGCILVFVGLSMVL